MITTAQEIAQYFRGSVSFDFDREDIVSYQQIENSYEDFYTLLNREAFSALLNDFLNYDNQLKEIFCDIFDAELGIHCFANKNAANSSRSRVNYFLNMPKYQYHRNDVSKVYLAFNSWLLFFGHAEMSVEWDKCPFCGNKMVKGVCSNASCKKTTEECIKASLELARCLAEEQAGVDTPTPECWQDIKENTEFYIEYKLGIARYKSEKHRDEELALQKKREEDVQAAIEELNQLSGIMLIEFEKSNPDFDSVLSSLTSSAAIKQAMKYNDKNFNAKFAEIQESIAKRKRKHEDALNEIKAREIFGETVKKFLANRAIIKQELTSETMDVFELKKIFEETNQALGEIKAGRKSGNIITVSETLEALQNYEDELRAKAAEHINKKIHDQQILDAQKKLITKANLILNKLNSIRLQDSELSLLMAEYNAEIESNAAFDDFRVERPVQYTEIVDPIRKKLAEFIRTENEQKLSKFKGQAEVLLSEAKRTTAKESKGASLQRRLQNITKNDAFASIRNNDQYKRYVTSITERVNALLNEERDYKLRVARHKKAKERAKTNFNKVCSLLLPIILFLVGQVLQYLMYADSEAVLLLDLFMDVPQGVLFGSTLLGAFSTIHVIVRSWRLADDGKNGKCWTYLLLSGVAFAAIPCVAGYVGIILTSILARVADDADGETTAKVFSIILPICFFIGGQILQYALYADSETVLLLDLFGDIPMGVLIVSSVLGVISTIHVIVRSWKLADDYEYKLSWTYILISCGLFAVIPCVTSYVGIILTTIFASSANKSSGESLGKFCSIVVPLACFIVGQVIQYSVYSASMSVVLLDLFGDIPIGILLIASLLGAMSTIHIMVRSWRYADDYEPGKSWTYMMIGSLLFLVMPAAAGYVGIVVTSILARVADDADGETTAKVFSIILPLVCFIIGQLVQYAIYEALDLVLLVDLFVSPVPEGFLYISTVLGIVSTLHIMIRSWKFADDYENKLSWTYLLIGSLLFAIVPCAAGYVGIVGTCIISRKSS